jgi:alkanesulfonate monooxygenase SsuD/methylene tetrahydromethanopterin reductase-like flavin-dependent oxidoreductase (luciferase family)
MELRIFTEPQQGATYDQELGVARTSEQYGLGGYFRTDHLHKGGSVTGLPGPTDVWVTLAGLARETSRIRLGSLMCCSTFRNPGHLAIMVAQVDAMSGGRVEFGLGAASFAGKYEAFEAGRLDHHALGIPLPPLKERFEGVTEQLALITGLWSAPLGEPYSFHGQHYEVTDYPALVRPVQSPRPPIIIGGHGVKRTPAIAARFADEYNINGATPAQCAEAYARVAEACEVIGRDPAEITWSAAITLCCGADDAEVTRRKNAITAAVTDFKDPTALIEKGATGTPSEVVERLCAFREAGANRVYLQLFDLLDLDQLQLVAEEVLPKLPRN